MHHAFDVELAQKYGVDEAVLIAHFQYWITYNASRKQNFFKGKFWTYNSYKSLTVYFPYFTEKQIRRIVGNLIEKGVLITDNFNQNSYDKTMWYSFFDESVYLQNIPESHYKASAQMGKGPFFSNFDVPKDNNPNAQTGKPIPDSNSDSNSGNKPFSFSNEN